MLNWQLANGNGIWMDSGWNDRRKEVVTDAWNSGHVNDLLLLSVGSIVAAAETGGIWIVPPDFTPALCVSNEWAHSEFNCLAFGLLDPVNQTHIYAGGESNEHGTALYVTDMSSPVPLLTWKQIPVPEKVGSIRRILVMEEIQRILLAYDAGLLWATIPPGASTAYKWQDAVIPSAGGIFDVTAGDVIVQRDFKGIHVINEVIAGGSADNPGLFWGAWDENDVLNLYNSTMEIRFPPPAFAGMSVASCASNGRMAYAVCTQTDKPDSSHLFAILKTMDGGRRWFPCEDALENIPVASLQDLAGHQGDYNNRIVVSAYNPEVVSFGFNNRFISFNGGDTWNALGLIPNPTNPKRPALPATPPHLHPDIHALKFRERVPYGPSELFIGSDGGIGSVKWGEAACIIKSDFTSDGLHADLDALVVENNKISHYISRSDDPRGHFIQVTQLPGSASGGACFTMSDYKTADRRHYEAVVLEGTDLVHYSADNSTPAPTWTRIAVITNQASGPGWIIQSNFYSFGHGHLEVVVPEGSNLVHYWREDTGIWNRTPTPITEHAASSACFIQSSFVQGQDHGNFELVVLEDNGGKLGAGLVHYSRDNGHSPYPWSQPTMIDQHATGPASLFQSTYGAEFGGYGNFEVLVPNGNQLVHWYRDNSTPPFKWVNVGPIGQPGVLELASAGCAIQADFGSDPLHRDFELIAAYGGRQTHLFRNSAVPSLGWTPTKLVSVDSYILRSDFNKQFPILQFYTLAASSFEPGLVAGGTQDNGVLYGIASHGGNVDNLTPWFQLEGGDGGGTIALSDRSSTGNLFAAGRVFVEFNNEEDEDSKKVGAKSAAWVSPTSGDTAQRLTQYPPGAAVIPLSTVDPSASPQPDPVLGLVDPVLTAVVDPTYPRPPKRNKAGLLCACGASKTSVYGLFLFKADVESVETPDREWRFIGKVSVLNKFGDDIAQQVTALSSVDGFDIVVGVLLEKSKALPPFAPNDGRIFRMSSETGNLSALPIDASVLHAVPIAISMVSGNEGYAITDSGMVLRWNGAVWQIAASMLPISLGKWTSLAVDRSQTPVTLFVASGNQVCGSHDRGTTWQLASDGLPKAVECSDLRWVKDADGSRLYLSTYGRSLWISDQTF